MPDLLSAEALSALMQVIGIDLVLAGDNAVVIGLAVAGLPAEQRLRAVVAGIAAATVLRILFASVAVELLDVVGLLLAGGLLLLWVSWKMWLELRLRHAPVPAGAGLAPPVPPARKTFRQALVQITLADVSMSLDNVLAVAGAAREHPAVLALGLVLSIALMGLASALIARLLERHRWIAYAGLAVILWVALHMVWEGARDAGLALAALG